MAIRTHLLSISALVALMSGLVISQNVSAAAGGQSITMTPPSTQLTIDPGSSSTSSFKVINNGNDSYAVNTSVSPYSVTGEAYDPGFTQLPGTTDVASWVHVSATHTTAQAHKTLEIPYTVTVPAATAPGGYYAVIFAETAPLDPSAASGVIPHNRVGDILYITVSGPVTNSGTTTVTPLSHIQVGNQIPMEILVANTGGVHFLSTAVFGVQGSDGKEVYKGTFDRYVLPNTKRLISTSWTPSAPIGFYKVTATATVAGKPTSITTQQIVYIAPWLLDIVAIAIGLLGVAIIVRLVTRRKRLAKR